MRQKFPLLIDPDEIRGPGQNKGARKKSRDRGWQERTILNSDFYHWNKEPFLMCDQ